jgi:hypothetical protein
MTLAGISLCGSGISSTPIRDEKEHYFSFYSLKPSIQMMMKLKKSLLAMALTAIVFSGCKKKEDPPPVNQGELITTVRLTFTAQGSNIPTTYVFRDLDGDGSAPPTTKDQIMLDKNTTYEMSIELLDESKNPVEDITEEIEEEKEEHLFVYTPSPANIMIVNITDRDANNLPVGLKAEVTAGTNAISNGSLKVQLRHQPPVNNQPTKNGSPTPGSDDVNIDFNVMIH